MELFHFTTTLSAPSSPRRLQNSFSCDYDHASAPASPSRTAAISESSYKELQRKAAEEVDDTDLEPFDFALGFSGRRFEKEGSLDAQLATADELFEGGKIRPLMLSSLPCNDIEHIGPSRITEEIKVSKETNKKATPRKAFSFSVSDSDAANNKQKISTSFSNLQSIGNREQEDQLGLQKGENSLMDYGVGRSGSKKWRLKDIFLFRSASEGRATGRGSRDPLRTYSILSSSATSSQKNVMSKRPSSSQNEFRYGASRAEAEELKKKKTSLAYQHNSMFNWLRFSPAAMVSKRSSLSRVS